MSSVTLTDVVRRFGDTTAVDGVSLTVPEGSITAVLGPSGCGKTTLLRLIAGFLEPDAGTIAVGDRVVAGQGRSVPPQRRRIGYVPQEGALFPHLDVAANITYGLSRRERSVAPVDALLEMVELPTLLMDRHPHELSGGQQQRVALARALAPKPDVVLLDEPFSSLDASLRASTGRAVVRALRAAGATAVLVTHDQDDALSLADQVAVVREGRVVQAASPHDLYRAPAGPDVARFVGGAVILQATVADGIASSVLGDLPVTGDYDAGEAQVLIRPEQVRIDDPALQSVAKARVDEVSFYGHGAAVRLTLLPNGPAMIARTSGMEAPEVGRTVAVSVFGPVTVF